LPQRATWMATGNNLRVGGDIARRCYWIHLDALTARPWQRDGFRHKDLGQYVLDHRGPLLTAALTLGEAGFAAGCPPASVAKVGGFEAWARTVGGVLAHAGVEGFLGNLDGLYAQVDEEEVAWEMFLKAWRDVYQDQPRTVAQITTDLQN